MRYKILVVILIVFFPVLLAAQGRTHNFLIGYNTLTDQYTTAGKARLLFDSVSIVVASDVRKMEFRAAQGNISDENGNLLMVSNGCWIADATGDTMLNGGGLTPPGSFTNDFCGLY